MFAVRERAGRRIHRRRVFSARVSVDVTSVAARRGRDGAAEELVIGYPEHAPPYCGRPTGRVALLGVRASRPQVLDGVGTRYGEGVKALPAVLADRLVIERSDASARAVPDVSAAGARTAPPRPCATVSLPRGWHDARDGTIRLSLRSAVPTFGFLRVWALCGRRRCSAVSVRPFRMPRAATRRIAVALPRAKQRRRRVRYVVSFAGEDVDPIEFTTPVTRR